MKINNVKFLTLCIVVFMVSGCKKKDDNNNDVKCLYISTFFEGVSKNLNNNVYYIVKGTVLDKVEYGLKIKLEEDLKRNFPKGVNTFIAYGGGPFTTTAILRKDNLSLYDKQDVLIMHLTRADDEKPSNGYASIVCTHSVVKLSDDYVTGHILPYEEIEWREGIPLEEIIPYLEILELRKQQNIIDTISIDDFQKKLNELLSQKK